MAAHHTHALEDHRLGSLGGTVRMVGLIAGLVAIAGAWVLSEGHSFIETYLTAYAVFLQMALGGLFFVLLQHTTRSGWSVVIRRVPEAMAMNLVIAAVLLIPIFIGENFHHLYHWADAAAVASDPILQAKAGYLNTGFFTIRMAVYFTLWIGLATFFFRVSRAQDESKDPEATLRMERWSYPGMVIFALSLNYGSYDLLMSLDPHWFSTMFGVYFFAGAVVSSLAMISLLVVWWRGAGKMPSAITKEHLHDIGKLLFAFVVFWAYIAFSQYMLIWYADLPEETGWILARQEGNWATASLVLLGGHFVVPFFFLLSRWIKRSGKLLMAASAWLIVMCWIDCWWLVMPTFGRAGLEIGLADVLVLIGMVAFFVAGVAHWLAKARMVPVGDPRLNESLRFHNI